MNLSSIHEPAAYYGIGQSQNYLPQRPKDEPVAHLSTEVDSYLSRMNFAEQQLEEIRQEAEEAYRLDNGIDPVPKSAYEEAYWLIGFLMKQIYHEIPMPDIMWSEDGAIGLEWRPGDGIATMSLCGDNHVIYGAFFNNKREVEGICSLSDTILLSGFLVTLIHLFK